VLRWVFHRDNEELVFEIRFANGHLTWATIPPRDPARPVEVFTDGLAAVRRQAVVERLLFGAGWSLDSFSSTPLSTRSRWRSTAARSARSRLTICS
jgi:hypothetical protein